MNAPKGPQADQNEEGGMLVAALAGAGILVAVGLLIFSGGDESATKGDAGSASDKAAASAAKAGGSKSAFEARKVDAAGKPIPADARGTAPTGRKPAGKGMMINEGLAADAPTRKPPTFDNPSDERAWWETQLKDAQRLQGMRQRGMDKLPEIEKDIEAAADPAAAREQYERRKERLQKALEGSNARIVEIEAKLLELQ